MAVHSRWFTADADVPTYGLDELMGTKLRALYQRRKGRDLFDLWLCLERGMVDPATVVRCFNRYMEAENHPVTRALFEQNLHGKSQDPAFLADINPLLAAGVVYDADVAFNRVREAFIALLHGEPWRGTQKS
jgi:predicted nucleotidyltransferase component of viral defense system